MSNNSPNFYDDLQRNFRNVQKPETRYVSPAYAPTLENYSFIDNQSGPYHQTNTMTGSRLVPQRMIPPNAYDSEREKFYRSMPAQSFNPYNSEKDKVLRSNAAYNNKVDYSLEREIAHHNQVGDMVDNYRNHTTRLAPEQMPANHPIHQIRGDLPQKKFKPRKVNFSGNSRPTPYDDAMFADRGGEETWMFWH
jgi:hypothetical protein